MEEIQSKYGQWEPPPNAPGTKALRWPNATKKRKAPPPDETVTNQETSIAGPNDAPIPEEPKYPGAKYILAAGGALVGAAAAASVGVGALTGAALGGAVSYMNAADNEIRDPAQKYLPPINGGELPKEPVPADPYDYDYSNYQTESDNLLAQQKAQREQKEQQKRQKQDDEAASTGDLPTIPQDSAQYSIPPTLDPMQAATAAVQQGLFRAGVTAGGHLAQRLLSMGGPYGYLGAAGVAAGTLTLDTMNRHFSEHYTKPYSERRGVHLANQLYGGGFPALSAERSINSLESSSLGERSNTNVVNVFTKQGSQLAGRGYDQVSQENRALRNYLQESQSPFVVPHQ